MWTIDRWTGSTTGRSRFRVEWSSCSATTAPTRSTRASSGLFPRAGSRAACCYVCGHTAEPPVEHEATRSRANDLAPEREQGDRDHLEVGHTQWDTDDGDAQQDPGDHVPK